jgi:beta-lactam-binding protein with PASTA domain
LKIARFFLIFLIIGFAKAQNNGNQKMNDKSFENAISILDSIGLSLGDISEKEDSSAVGTILSQDPAPGTILPPGAPVKLTVSLGQFVIMPSVIGMNVDEAKSLLEKQGFRISHIDETDTVKASGKIVLYQYPMPGLKVRSGIEVRLKISK